MTRAPIQTAALASALLLAASPGAFAATEGDWDFDQDPSDQIFEDDSVNGNDLTRGETSFPDSKDPAFSTDTPHGGTGNYSAQFDGTNDVAWIDIDMNPSLSPTGELTAASWVKLDDLTLGGGGTLDENQDIIFSNLGVFGGGGGIQLGFGNGNNPGLFFIYRDEVAGSYYDRGASISLSSLGWTEDTWYHVAATYDEVNASQAQVRLFVDGQPVASAIQSGHVDYTNTDYFLLGTNIDGAGSAGGCCDRELDGHLDEVKLYSHERSDAAIRNLAEIDIRWDNISGGNASTRTDWDPEKLPTYASRAILQDLGTSYTVNLDADGWEVLDLHIEDQAVADLNAFTLTTEEGVDLAGTARLNLDGAHVQGNGTITTSAGSEVVGFGTIDQSFSNNTGTIRAEGGILSVALSANDNDGTLNAGDGAVLQIRNSADLTNRDTVILAGGTLSPQSGTYNLVNAASGDLISGYGSIDGYRVDVGDGTLTATGGALSLADGFLGANDTGTINVQTGATLAVTGGWTNQSALNLGGGSLTGGTLTQSGNLQVTGGTSTIQNVVFSAGSTNALSGNASLHISGAGTMNGAAIAESGLGGTLVVDFGATLGGYGTIAPDTTVEGTLDANASGNTLTVSGALGVSTGDFAYASSGGTLTAAGPVTNDGYIYAFVGSTVDINGAITNTGSVYSNGGTVNLTQDVVNRADVFSNGGVLSVSGAIKSNASATGDFDARSGALNINGAIEVGARNTFSADTGGTLTFANDLNTGNLFQTQALFLNGGMIDLAAGKTLTNADTKEIIGHGVLLSEDNILVNDYLIEASGGTLTVHGTITNNNTMRAEGAGDALVVASTLSISDLGQVAATGGASVDLQSPLDNDGFVYAAGGGSVLSVADTSPTGSGTFSAQDGGTILLADGFTNADLTDPDALALDGGTFATSPGGTITNAAGQRILGRGTLLATGMPAQTLDNQGTVETSGGSIDVQGDLDNAGMVRASAGESIAIGGALANNGRVEISAGAELSARSSSADTGVYSIAGGRLRVDGDLALGADAVLEDNDLAGMLEVVGDLTKTAGAEDLFDGDLLDVTIAGREGVLSEKHLIDWGATDLGAVGDGLIDNLALGALTFGNGVGNANSDAFDFDPDSILYAFGLVIEADAFLDLNGATLYYLQAGDIVNGIVGTGFDNQGSYFGGQIIEIDIDPASAPAPASLLLLVSGLGLIGLRRRVPCACAG